MKEIKTDYSLPHIIHNNLMELINSRSNNSCIPKHFPPKVLEQKDDDEKIDAKQQLTDLSCNLNIILNSTAIVENSLECIIISPFNTISSDTPKIIKSSLSILKSDLIRVSSLGRYFDYFQKLYNKKVKDITEEDELMSINLLFDIRNIIIHCSALSAKKVIEENRGYLYVDDPFYLDVLKRVKRLMNLEEEYYCLPESLLCWNKFVDQLLINSHSVIVKLTELSKETLPSIDVPLFYYGISGFIKYGQVK